MYEIGFEGSVTTRTGSFYELASPLGTQLKYDIDRKQDATIETEDDGEKGVIFVPYHAVNQAIYMISATETADPVDDNCRDESDCITLFDGDATFEDYEANFESEKATPGTTLTVTMTYDGTTVVATGEVLVRAGTPYANLYVGEEEIGVISFADGGYMEVSQPESGSVHLTVTQCGCFVSVSNTDVSIRPGETATVTVTSSAPITGISVSDTSIATVTGSDGEYVITGAEEGNATITFSNGKCEGSCAVTVSSK